MWSWILATIGVTGIFLVGRKTIVGWLILCVNECLWIAYALATSQYGFIAMALAYAAVYPLMTGFNALPKAAFVPILVVWFGIGIGPAILTAFLISFFPIMVNIATGLATLEPELEDVLRVLGAKRWDVLVKVGLPRSMPYFYGSLKVAITQATTVITAAITAVGKLVSGFQFLYEKYKQFVDFIKNNPLSKFLGKINPFDNASFTGASFLTAGQTTTTASEQSMAEVGPNALEQLFSNPNFAKNLVTGLSISEKRLIDQYFATGGQGALVNRFNPETDLMPIVEEIRARDIAYQNARLATVQTAPINVNIGVVGDPESAARTIVDLLNSSTARGTGGSGALY